MLFDYRKQTDIVSKEGLISWLETKSPDEGYNFADCEGACLFSLYLQDRLFLEPARPHVHGTEFWRLWDRLHLMFGTEVAATGPFTMGDALKRARAL